MKENKPVLGVIGGMGPLASQLFYKMVVEKTSADKDQDHIDMVILNHASMMDRTEAIMTDKLDELLHELVRDARFLESGGADYGIIPCNTCHVLYDDLQKKTDIQLINMIDAAAEHVVNQFGEGTRVGIMATTGTVKMELYQKACEKKGLIPIVPKASNQELVMKLIYEGVKKGNPIQSEDLVTVENEFRQQNCACVIMGCTELSCLKDEYQLPEFYIDAMEIAARKAILLCGRQVRG